MYIVAGFFIGLWLVNKMASHKDRKLLQKMLDKATEPEQAMTLEQLYGFLFGVAMTPDMVMPSEWLPVVFGEEMITVDSEKEGQQLLDTLMQVVNDLTDRFHKKNLEFPFDMGKLSHGEDLLPIQEWIFGFNEALMLRPECWFEDDLPEDLSEDQEELLTSMSVIEGIADPIEAGKLFDTNFEDDDQSTRLVASLFLMLPTAVKSLIDHATILEAKRQESFRNHKSRPIHARHTPKIKIGRNEPCPCGSGEKHKKCCLLKEKIVPIR